MLYATNQYSYYDHLREDDRNYQQKRNETMKISCPITPDESLGESVKNYYRQHGYV